MNTKKNHWHLYILQCGNNSLYTGITTDIRRRIDEHKSGKGAKYTRGKGPFRLVYTQKFRSRSAASKREAEIKKMTKEKKKGLIKKNSGISSVI